jgi:hypothetical protein
LPFGFIAIASVLAFAIWRSEERPTHIFLACALLLKLVSAGMTFVKGDADRLRAFERVWGDDDPGYHLQGRELRWADRHPCGAIRSVEALAVAQTST